MLVPVLMLLNYCDLPCRWLLTTSAKVGCVKAGSVVMSGDLESAAESINKRGAFPLVEADCSLVGQSPAHENGSNLPEGLDDFTTEQVMHVTVLSCL